MVTNLKEKTKFLVEEGIVILQVESKERVGLGERTASGNDLGAPSGDQVKGRKFLKDPHGIGCTQNRHGTRKTDPLRARGGGREKDNRGRIEKLLAVMLPDTKDIQSDAIRGLHFLEQIPETDYGVDQCPAHGIRQCGDEAIESDLHDIHPTSSRPSEKISRRGAETLKEELT
jgi:hypothetical protein